MRKTLRHRSEGLLIASALRGELALFEPDTLAYDPETPARCNDVVLAEVVSVVADSPADDGLSCLNRAIETVRGDAHHLTFTSERVRPSVIATCAGNRYAPRSVLGGLHHPLTGAANAPVRGGTMVDDLSMCNIVGFANFTVAGHRRTRLRVLGLLLDGPGIPVNLARRSQTPPRVEGPSPRVVLVAGSSMDAGKTTCAVALARHLRAAGRRITFEKKTGTTCFADPLKVQVEDPLAFGATDTSLTVSRDDLRVCDFVDATGMVSDISGDLTQFVERSLAFTPWFTATRGSDVHIVELADNLSHVSNLALARDCRFRQMVSGLVYVPSPSFDAAHHMLAFLRESLDWPDLPVAFSGPIANDLEWEAVRLEVEARLGVPCLPSRGRATAALADWAQTCVTRKRGAG